MKKLRQRISNIRLQSRFFDIKRKDYFGTPALLGYEQLTSVKICFPNKNRHSFLLNNWKILNFWIPKKKTRCCSFWTCVYFSFFRMFSFSHFWIFLFCKADSRKYSFYSKGFFPWTHQKNVSRIVYCLFNKRISEIIIKRRQKLTYLWREIQQNSEIHSFLGSLGMWTI